MIGLEPLALWELWQRLAALEQAARQERAHRADRKRQAGGGRKKDAMSFFVSIAGQLTRCGALIAANSSGNGTYGQRCRSAQVVNLISFKSAKLRITHRVSFGCGKRQTIL